MLDRPHEAFANHRPHGPAEELELECDGDQPDTKNLAFQANHRILLAGFLLSLTQTIPIAFAVLELEGVNRGHVGRNLDNQQIAERN